LISVDVAAFFFFFFFFFSIFLFFYFFSIFVCLFDSLGYWPEADFVRVCVVASWFVADGDGVAPAAPLAATLLPPPPQPV